MSGGTFCEDRKAHRPHWRVTVRKANYSAFNGGRRTPSDYSELHCRACGHVWRTRAAYVDQVSDAEPPCTRCGGNSRTVCRICRKPFCGDCFTDHHHEGYGTPATNDH